MASKKKPNPHDDNLAQDLFEDPDWQEVDKQKAPPETPIANDQLAAWNEALNKP